MRVLGLRMIGRTARALHLAEFALLTGSILRAQVPAAPQEAPCVDSLLNNCNAAGQTQPMQQPMLSPSASSGVTPPQSMTSAGSQVYVDSAGNPVQARRDTRTTGQDERNYPPEPLTDLQKLARTATGETLPIFGRDFFQAVPSTFAPGDELAVTPDYVLGPGDRVLLRLWGPENFNSQLTVDRSGSIFIPKLGAVHVAGLQFSELQEHIRQELSRVYRNFNLSVNLGQLHSIQIYVVGEARHPGAYTVSSFSTVLNALFASGGPNAQGSLRHIQVRRSGQTLPEFDLYDLVLRGDKTQDTRLQSGDTIFIPPVGAQVALGGSVRHPAIYELGRETTLGDILRLAGGFSATASPSQISLERIENGRARQSMDVVLNEAGRGTPLRDGDVLFAGHISAGYEQSVTLRGNLANPGRFSWHEGMRLADILPDTKSLLTVDYWRERNKLGLPVPLFEPQPEPRRLPQVGSQNLNTPAGPGVSRLPDSPQNSPNDNTQRERDEYTQEEQYALAKGLSQSTENPDRPVTERVQDASQNGSVTATAGTLAQTQPAVPTGKRPVRNTISIPTPEIDWSYAVIERLDPVNLKDVLVPFNLGRLVKDHDPAQNLELQPGDVITILSQNDVLVPQDLQTKYIRLEGEFMQSGVYSVGPEETLRDLVARAGGLTSKAYLYGSSFNRESARAFQQQRLDEYITTLSTDMERATAVRAVSSASGVLDATALAEQRSLIAQLRQLRATGRVVLEFRPESASIDGIPAIPLENGDVFRVPSRPNTVSVLGSVYGQNVFLYNPSRKLDDYVALAGRPNRIADRKHAFIIRADGSIFSRERAQGVLSNHFDSSQINPGDAIVVPEKLIKPTALRQLIDYSQILSSFGLAAAAINVVR